MGTDRGGLPPFVVAKNVARSNRSLISDGLDEGAFVEFRDGASAKTQMSGLLVVTKSALATAKGRWLEGILLGCDSTEWLAWYDNLGPADASHGDATGIFHVCSRKKCTARASRADRPEVHMMQCRVLTRAQAGKLSCRTPRKG